jgi:hypothetical protein
MKPAQARTILKERPEVAHAVRRLTKILLQQIKAHHGRWPDPIVLPCPLTPASTDAIPVFRTLLERQIGRPVRVELQ